MVTDTAQGMQRVLASVTKALMSSGNDSRTCLRSYATLAYCSRVLACSPRLSTCRKKSHNIRMRKDEIQIMTKEKKKANTGYTYQRLDDINRGILGRTRPDSPLHLAKPELQIVHGGSHGRGLFGRSHFQRSFKVAHGLLLGVVAFTLRGLPFKQQIGKLARKPK